MLDPQRGLVLADVLIVLTQAHAAANDRLAAERAFAEARAIHARHRSVGELRVRALRIAAAALR